MLMRLAVVVAMMAGFAVSAYAEPVVQGHGFTIERGVASVDRSKWNLCPDGSPIRPGNYCPGDIELTLEPMEPAPDGAGCVQPGYVLAADRTHCVKR